ncbi:DUF1294 domain-containing protein [Pseudomonas sp. OTU5201]|uniref:DUF1294 domain-containing protein n=1 Tax=Pseudomonas sp. OTU5201 TaxID=3043850 RepID=UPI00313DB08E
MRRVAALASLSVAAPVSAEVYRCVQPDGVVQYTDRGCASLEASQPLVASNPGALTGLLQHAESGVRQVLPWLGGLSLGQLVLLTYAFMSLVCFVAYWRDKRFAVAGAQRTPESRLHLYELLGGWPGGLMAQRLIRHKSRKVAYQVKFWLIVAVHLGLLGFWVLH